MILGYWTSAILRVASCSGESDQKIIQSSCGERRISAYVQKRDPKMGVGSTLLVTHSNIGLTMENSTTMS